VAEVTVSKFMFGVSVSLAIALFSVGLCISFVEVVDNVVDKGINAETATKNRIDELEQRILAIESQLRLGVKQSESEPQSKPGSAPPAATFPKGDPYRNFRADEVDWLVDDDQVKGAG
jgi:hypothetical protein